MIKLKHHQSCLIFAFVLVSVIVSIRPQLYAYTDSVSTNNYTALTILITPNVDRGVEISSSNVNLDLGSVDMYTSTYTVRPATITILGTISTTELTLSAAISGGWSFDSTPLVAETDKLSTWALFSSIAITSAPSSSEFQIYNSTIASDTASQSATGVGDASSRYEGGWNGSDMDSMAPGTKRHLWIKMQTPSATSITTQQTIVFDLAVEAAN